MYGPLNILGPVVGDASSVLHQHKRVSIFNNTPSFEKLIQLAIGILLLQPYSILFLGSDHPGVLNSLDDGIASVCVFETTIGRAKKVLTGRTVVENSHCGKSEVVPL
jgi:hypothetical protein